MNVLTLSGDCDGVCVRLLTGSFSVFAGRPRSGDESRPRGIRSVVVGEMFSELRLEFFNKETSSGLR